MAGEVSGRGHLKTRKRGLVFEPEAVLQLSTLTLIATDEIFAVLPCSQPSCGGRGFSKGCCSPFGVPCGAGGVGSVDGQRPLGRWPRCSCPPVRDLGEPDSVAHKLHPGAPGAHPVNKGFRWTFHCPPCGVVNTEHVCGPPEALGCEQVSVKRAVRWWGRMRPLQLVLPPLPSPNLAGRGAV